MIDLSIAKL